MVGPATDWVVEDGGNTSYWATVYTRMVCRFEAQDKKVKTGGKLGIEPVRSLLGAGASCSYPQRGRPNELSPLGSSRPRLLLVEMYLCPPGAKGEL